VRLVRLGLVEAMVKFDMLNKIERPFYFMPNFNFISRSTTNE
jgi:hypothetical protein